MKNNMSLNKSQIAAYSVLRLPLAFVFLPVYIYIPKFYQEISNLSFLAMGQLILLLRVLDTLQDPFIGWISDKFQKNSTKARYNIILISSFLLCISLIFLFNPPYEQNSAYTSGLWMSLAMFFTYLFFSFMLINLDSLPSEITSDYNMQTKLVSVREGFGLIGVLLGIFTISYLIDQYQQVKAFYYLNYGIIPLILICSIITFKFSPIPKPRIIKDKLGSSNQDKFLSVFKNIYNDSSIKGLMTAAFINAIAQSIPAATILYYIENVLEAKEHTPGFLATYFISGAASMVLWNKVSYHIGKKNTWLISLIGSIFVFFWAYWLESGDIFYYYIICILSGIFYGADIIFPFSILADLLQKYENKSQFFGVWSLLSKLSLALASGLSFLFLGFLGIETFEQAPPEYDKYLAFLYAVIPCFFQAAAIYLVLKGKFDEKYN